MFTFCLHRLGKLCNLPYIAFFSFKESPKRASLDSLYVQGEVMGEKILIVEDYEDTRFLMKFLLESFGYQVIEATDGLEAVDRFKNQHPDLILMDISLPVVDGLTATKVIREFDATGKVPIIAVTAFGNSYYKQAMEAGCNDLISKPLDFDKLEPVLNKYLGH